MTFRVVRADMRRVLRYMAPESVDALVCDPPYELGFMGRAWDRAGVAFDPETWRAGLRVLKPGGRLLAFGAPRTAHRIWCAVEDAGFVIEDTVAWMFGNGFPKHRSKLKPAYEPVCVARKGGVSDLNIDAARVGDDTSRGDRYRGRAPGGGGTNIVSASMDEAWAVPAGRWPPNVAMDEEAARRLDELSGELHSHGGGVSTGLGFGSSSSAQRAMPPGDSGGASRFMYVAKASRAERETGLEDMEADGRPYRWNKGGEWTEATSPARNNHPTIKPVALMRWLVRLVTQPGDLVLDPFTGSGTTGIACMLEGRRFVGIEMDPAYAEIARKRIAAWKRYAVPDDVKDTACPDTLDLFGDAA